MKKDKAKKEKGSFKKTVKNNVYILKTIRKYSKWFIPLTALEATTHSLIIFLPSFRNQRINLRQFFRSAF